MQPRKQQQHHLVRQVANDQWGRQLPSRMLMSILEFSSIQQIATSQAVCGSWVLPVNLSDRLWRPRYEADWEVDSAHDPRIACGGGADGVTPWAVRYRRRHQTELNWLACRPTSTSVLNIGDDGLLKMTGRGNHLVVNVPGKVSVYDVPTLSLVAQTSQDGERVYSRHISPDGSCFVGNLSNGDFVVLSLPNLKQLTTTRRCGFFAVTDGKTVLSSDSKHLQQFDVFSNQEKLVPHDDIWCLAANWDQKTAYVSSASEKLWALPFPAEGAGDGSALADGA